MDPVPESDGIENASNSNIHTYAGPDISHRHDVGSSSKSKDNKDDGIFSAFLMQPPPRPGASSGRASLADIAIALMGPSQRLAQGHTGGTKSMKRFVHPFGNTRNIIDDLLRDPHMTGPPGYKFEPESSSKLALWLAFLLFMLFIAFAIIITAGNNICFQDSFFMNKNEYVWIYHYHSYTQNNNHHYFLNISEPLF